MMPWETMFVSAGTTVYVDGNPYVAVGFSLSQGMDRCPPYLAVTVHDESPQDGPKEPVAIQDHGGPPIWWLSHCRVEWDAPRITEGHPGQKRLWQR